MNFKEYIVQCRITCRGEGSAILLNFPSKSQTLLLQGNHDFSHSPEDGMFLKIYHLNIKFSVVLFVPQRVDSPLCVSVPLLANEIAVVLWE